MDRRAAAAIEQRGSTRPREARPDLLAWIHSRQAANHPKIKMKQALEKARKALTNTDSQIPLIEAQHQENGFLEEVIEVPLVAARDKDGRSRRRSGKRQPPAHPVWAVSPDREGNRVENGESPPPGGRLILDARNSKSKIPAVFVDGASFEKRFVPFKAPIGDLVSEVHGVVASVRGAENIIAKYKASRKKGAATKAEIEDELKWYVEDDSWFVQTLDSLRDPEIAAGHPSVEGLIGTVVALRAKNTAVQKFIDT